MRINPHIEAYQRAKDLVNFIELHDPMEYNKARSVIEGVNEIFASMERRKGGRNHGEQVR